jgi:hypothetical protein
MKRHTGIAAFSDLRTPSADGVRDAITTRPSASANFFVDSVDKAEGQVSSNFTISKGQSLFNGFFNRISVAEIVLDWGIPNIAAYWGNDYITIENATTSVQFQVVIPDSFFRVVDLVQYIVDAVNADAISAGDPLRLTSEFTSGSLLINSTGVGNDPFTILSTNPATPSAGTNLPRQLFFSVDIDVPATSVEISSPLILGTRYIDIVCQQLTYNQELKDNTTSNNNRDVLYRWYFTYDNVPVAYDYITAQINAGDPAAPVPYPPTFAQVLTDIPIIEGYTSFVSRRTPPVVKQIRWSPEQPIGQVNFQVYDDQGRLLDLPNGFPGGYNFQFQMSLLLSED